MTMVNKSQKDQKADLRCEDKTTQCDCQEPHLLWKCDWQCLESLFGKVEIILSCKKTNYEKCSVCDRQR